MTVSISKMSIDYYLQSAMTGDAQINNKPDAMTNYYTETATPAGRWFGSGLEGLGIKDGEEVTRTGARRLYEDLAHPKTAEPLGTRKSRAASPVVSKTPAGRTSVSNRESVAGFDLTFSVPKSVSALWALGDYSVQSRVEEAHQQAMTETLQWVERDVAQTRAGSGGVAHVAVKGLVGTSFDHWESRDGDPQLHTHAVLSNRVQRASDGQWATLDSYTLHRHVVAISETYNSLLFDRLHEQVGAVPESRSPSTDANVDAALRAVVNEADVSTPDMRHRVELAGVPDALIKEFSSRSVLIEERKDELIETYRAEHGREPSQATILQLRQRATLETRAPKATGDTEAVPLAQKKYLWRQRALASGHDPATIVAGSVGGSDQMIRASMLDDSMMQQLSTWTLADASQRHPTFTRANVVASSERVLRLVRCDSAEQRRALVDGVVDRAMDSAVALTPRRSTSPETDDPSVSHRGVSAFEHQRHSGVWTTQEMLDSESYLLERYEAQGAPAVDAETAHQTVAQKRTGSGHQLSSDQVNAATSVVSSGRSVDAVIGPAGTGKTTTMRAVSDVWEDHHGAGSVIGLAPSAAAAKVLSDDLGAPTDNTAKWIYETTEGAAIRAQRVHTRTDRLEALQAQAETTPSPRQHEMMEQLRAQLAQDYAEQAKYTMRPNQLVLIDEASMVSTAHMTQLAHQADQAGAKIVLVGDPSQLGSVDAGGFLGHIDRQHEPARLDQAHRFDNEWEQHASLKLRSGETSALDTYNANGRLHGGSDVDVVSEAYQAWQTDRQAGRDSILIAADNHTVRDLNQRAQTDLVASGNVDLSSTAGLRDDATAGAGDVVLARRNDRSIRDSTGTFLANGTRMDLTEIRGDGSAVGVSRTTGGTIELDRDYLASSTELGYATTAHRSQGVTTDTAHAVANTGLSRELFYVSMTRGREANHVYINQDTVMAHAPDRWDMLHEASMGETPHDLLQTVLARSSAERTATETSSAELAWSNDLGRIISEREYLGWAGRSSRTQEWVQQNYSPETATAFRDSAEWNQLVKADPAKTYIGPTYDSDSAANIISQCENPPTSDHGPTGIENPTESATDGQRTLLADTDSRMRSELASRRAALETDPQPPLWYRQLHDDVPEPQHRREAVNAVLGWRAVSHHDDPAEPLGHRPTEGRLQPYYDRAAATIRSRQPWDSPAEHRSGDVEKLKRDPVHFAGRRPQPQQQESPQSAPAPAQPKHTGPEL